MKQIIINLMHKNPDLFFGVIFYLGLICFYFVIRCISRLTDYNEPNQKNHSGNSFNSDKYDYNS